MPYYEITSVPIAQSSLGKAPELHSSLPAFKDIVP